MYIIIIIATEYLKEYCIVKRLARRLTMVNWKGKRLLKECRLPPKLYYHSSTLAKPF